MIELPRAAVTAGEIADTVAEFFSFGTNDLTQTAFGFSRTTSASSSACTRSASSCQRTPSSRSIGPGVGALMRTAVEAGKANPSLHLGICGEHGAIPPASCSATSSASTT